MTVFFLSLSLSLEISFFFVVNLHFWMKMIKIHEFQKILMARAHLHLVRAHSENLRSVSMVIYITTPVENSFFDTLRLLYELVKFRKCRFFFGRNFYGERNFYVSIQKLDFHVLNYIRNLNMPLKCP